MTLLQFIQTNIGKKVDYDGHFGAQCVDLYRKYCEDVLEIPQSPAVSGAKEIIKNPGVMKVTNEHAFAEYSPGDVLVWGATPKNKYGHVAILVATYGLSFFIVLEQDGFAQDGVKLALRSRENLLGGLFRPLAV